jgi:hypothetical protein
MHAVPYYLTAGCYTISAVSYYLFFRRMEPPARPAIRPAALNLKGTSHG